MNIEDLTILAARKSLDNKEYSAEELARTYLDAIAAKNTEINAYVEVFEDVIEQARAADARIASGTAQAMTGIPLGIKDNLLIEGRRVSAGSNILRDYVASYDATAIAKLREQGAVLLGRTNMDEFAMGSSTEHSAFGPTKNPHDTTRVPGGSSGGSAAAVAAKLALGALGSDTGGSVRQPAALTGVVGFKPTYGAISRYGLIAMGSSLDQIGTFTNTVSDARMLFEAVRGHDTNDSTTLTETFFSKTSKRPRIIGVPRSFLASGVDKDVLERFDSELEGLAKRGYEVKDIQLPSFRAALAAYYIIMPAEASTNLARFDGVRYGFSAASGDIHELYRKTRGEGFGPEVRRRILLGTFVLSAGYFDAYYRRAAAVRKHIRADIARALKDVDVIATPTSPTPAFMFGEKNDPLAMYAADIFTVPINLAGVPAISVPMGSVKRGDAHMPVGMQWVAGYGGEDTLFTAVWEAAEE